MKASARSISRRSPRSARRPGEVRTKSLFQSCTACRSARPPRGRPGACSSRRRSWRTRGSSAAGRRPGRPGRLQRVDHVAAVGRQAERVDVGRPRLGVLPGDPAHLDHRHATRRRSARPPSAAACGRWPAGGARCCRRTSRRSRRPAAGTPGPRDLGEPVAQVRRPRTARRSTARCRAPCRRRDRRRSGHGGCCAAGRDSASVQPGAQVRGEREQLGQYIHRGVDGPVHGAQE